MSKNKQKTAPNFRLLFLNHAGNFKREYKKSYCRKYGGENT
jgi:hypothetical protein